jgi:hypothetical protein
MNGGEASLVVFFGMADQLSAVLTHYGTTLGRIYFGADYIAQQK